MMLTLLLFAAALIVGALAGVAFAVSVLSGIARHGIGRGLGW